ncbi:cysteine peptidase family C39 domain-containing protein [Aureliella helgolandensis]|uniref:Peptidase C39 family protein n=1 Tax=Aureliella helgolandensis TaxID=2527968 RepID=A0A518G541_9BACT|nr:cysteine peptidase family C39 domain-containing protein [Aureliella helgolandensis]QDV23716.1 Peptidase C39 family protein [Aureliella helgolandensis]
MSFLSTFTSGVDGWYEPQQTLPKQRMCGAAALVMAYRRCGIDIDQNSVWDEIAHEFEGFHRASTRDLAVHALQTGLEAVVVQTHLPFQALESCWQNNLPAILNHRVAEASPEGHFSLLAGINHESVFLSDPIDGPCVEKTRQEFGQLWLPTKSGSEIAGNVLVILGNPEEQPSLWCHCNRLFPHSIECERCAATVPLRPTRGLGCWNPGCTSRLWWRLFCPYCDHAIHAF